MLYFGKITAKDLKNELSAQIQKLKSEGFVITHLDSHEHVHMLPWVLETVLELCVEFFIPYIRLPLESPRVPSISFNVKDLIRHKALRFFACKAQERIPKLALCSNDVFLGHFHSGRIDINILLLMADNITDGITELAVHPSINSNELSNELSWYRNGSVEMEALMSQEWQNKLKHLDISLIPHSLSF